MVKVSIIIPCYNGISYLDGLSKCLYESISEYTEVIFIDDGSTDGSAAKFRELFPLCKVLQKKNMGLAAARNSGAEIARGEFLQFLDVDDLIDANKIMKQYIFACSNDLDVVYSDWQMVVVKEFETIFEPWFKKPLLDEPGIEFLNGWWNPPHSYLIKRSSYFDVGGSDESLVNAQDFDLFLRLAIGKKRFGYLEGNFCKYFRYDNILSLARKSKRQYWTDYEKAVIKCYEILNYNGCINGKYLDVISARLFVICRNIYKIDKIWAKDLFQRIRMINPNFKSSDGWIYSRILEFFGLDVAEFFVKRYKNLLILKKF